MIGIDVGSVDAGGVLRGLTLLSFGALCLIVVAVGAFAVLAELVNTWEWYFRMEQVIALSTPLVTALLGVTFVGAVGTVLTSSTG